ncbi:hypothetical protein R3W88_014768 [Solanum pinnatisectum]|uniref:Reverse transcriptase n=1 Tax=Solanum pinnatisectum TaxID=50273 RepID=A0AAV9KUY1_9SOLN|nr:hypothetical protein R3W88_014768 [Solanum pinnatisectum]
MLVYGSEAVIPAEVEIPTLRIIQEVGLDDAKWIHSRHEQLMLIDEKRMDTVFHGQLYQNRMTKAFNKKVKPRQFAPGQLVLKKIFPHQGEAKGKFAPNWQGPYMVHRVLSKGVVILEEMDGRVSTKPINSDAIKKYYIENLKISAYFLYFCIFQCNRTTSGPDFLQWAVGYVGNPHRTRSPLENPKTSFPCILELCST